MAKLTTPTPIPVAAKVPKVPKVPNQAVTVLAPTNPKRGKSAPRFALYAANPTTHSYILAGGYAADIAWDSKRGFIALAPLV